MSDNILTTIDELFKKYSFNIPKYQRSYAWEEEQLEVFIEDLRHQLSAKREALRDDAKKPYFFGTLLLHATKNGQNECSSVDVVDGQQRLTTTLIFIATALQQVIDIEDKELIQSNYISHPKLEQKFITLEKDQACFRSAILGIDRSNEVADTQSSKKLVFARDYFIEQIETDEWQAMVSELRNAQVLAYVIDNLSTATQIFEFQNDRGKKLTNLEAMKSFLMHNVHLNTKSASEVKLNTIHGNFEAIFRDIENLEQHPRTPEEDSILSYHCAAYIPWTDAEYQHPKKLVKKQIKAVEPSGSEATVIWIDQFITDLKQSYRNVLSIYSKIDEYTEFSHLVVLNRLAPFWPLLIKTYQADTSIGKQQFRKVCYLLEVFSFRAYGLANLRSNAGNSHLLWMAKKFNTMTDKGRLLDFDWVYEELTSACSWWDISSRMKANLQNANFYQNQKKSALYILWRYENYLRDGNEKQNQWSKLSWRDIVIPKSHAEKLSLEHIAAQNHDISNTLVCWDDEEPTEFKGIALHRLGNLVIDSISSNSSKSDDDFDKKWQRLSESSTYLSQGELKRFTSKETKTWDVEAIKNRQASLTKFVEKHWNLKPE